MMEVSSRELVKRKSIDGIGGWLWSIGTSGIPPMSWHRADLTTRTWNRRSRDFRSESVWEMVGLEHGLLRINVIHDLVGLRLEPLVQ